MFKKKNFEEIWKAPRVKKLENNIGNDTAASYCKKLHLLDIKMIELLR